MTVPGFLEMVVHMLLVSLSAAVVRAVQTHPDGLFATYVTSRFLALYLLILQLIIVTEVQISKVLFGKRLGVKNMRTLENW